MSKCGFCKEVVPQDELVADHIVPLSRGGKAHDPANIRWVHRACHNNKRKWYWRLWYRFLDWLDSLGPCQKEMGGYNCQHRIMSNGRKECGGDE